MPNSRVDEELLFSDVAYGPPGGETHKGDIRPELVFGNQYARPLRGNVFPALNVDPIDRMEKRITNGSDEPIEKVAPANAHSFNPGQRRPLRKKTSCKNF